MSDGPVYLVYCDIGTSPTDMDDLCVAWTDVMYYAKLRVNYMMKKPWINPSSIHFKTFQSMDDMTEFLSTFDMNLVDIENLHQYALCLYQTNSPLGSSHIGIWTETEVTDGVEIVYNLGEFKNLENAIGVLLYATLMYFRDLELKSQIKRLSRIIAKYLRLYALRESFCEDIERVVDDNVISADFQTVRDAIMRTDKLDLVTPHILEYWYHVFDQTEMLYRVAHMSVLGGDI